MLLPRFTVRSDRVTLVRGSQADMNAGLVSPMGDPHSQGTSWFPALPRHNFGDGADSEPWRLPLRTSHSQSLPAASARNVAPEFSILFHHGFGIDAGSLGGRSMRLPMPTLTAFLSTGMQIVSVKSYKLGMWSSFLVKSNPPILKALVAPLLK
jgi:hypothetical protein